MAKDVHIKVKSFDSSLLENAIKKIIISAKSNKAVVSGPIPLPTHRERYTILRSVHVNKKSREQFEIRTHKRLLILSNVDDKLMDGLKRIEIPSGVSLSLKVK